MTQIIKWPDEKPEWWPEWMTPPTFMRNGYAYPLGACSECGAQQYPMSMVESHGSSCSRSPMTKSLRTPWPRSWAGWPLAQGIEHA